jgi:hypothetical protein
MKIVAKKIKKLEYFCITQALRLVSRVADSEAKIGQEGFETGEAFFRRSIYRQGCQMV